MTAIHLAAKNGHTKVIEIVKEKIPLDFGSPKVNSGNLLWTFFILFGFIFLVICLLILKETEKLLSTSKYMPANVR